MGKELVMNDYLKGLKELFNKYGVTEAYTEYRFSNEREDGTALYINGDKSGIWEITEYIDRYTIYDEGILPTMYSVAVYLADGVKPLTHCIYKDGKFYE